MKTTTLISRSSTETYETGVKLALCLKKGMTVTLNGPMGAGKTTFVRGVTAGLGVDDRTVSSPTYAIMNIYRGKIDIYHIDLYRIKSADDIEASGIFSYPHDIAVTIIEWPDIAADFLIEPIISLNMSYVADDDNARKLVITSENIDFST